MMKIIKASKIHISQTTKNLLNGKKYIINERGTLEVKGKGLNFFRKIKFNLCLKFVILKVK